MSELLRRLRFLLHRSQFERELEEEMQHHLDMAGHQQFGNVALVKEDSRAMWTFTFWEQFAQDIRYGFRAMVANKLFTAMAALSLALGIGANTAIFSFMDAIMLRVLPVTHPEQLVILNWRAKLGPPVVHALSGDHYAEPGGGDVSPAHPYPAYELLRDNNQVLSGFFGHYDGGGALNLVIDGQAALAQGQYVTGDFFSTLGIAPAAGRLIGREDDREGAPPVAVMTYDYWTSRLGANPAAIGKAIQINGAAFTLAGVCAPGFFGVSPDSKPQVFLPIANIGLTNWRRDWPGRMRDGNVYWVKLMGRLKPGVSLAQAEAQLAALYGGFVRSTATKERERSNLPALWLQEGGGGLDSMRRRYSKPLWVLMAMAGLILGVACANIANLLLARAATRRREIAVRLSLGAGRVRVIRQLLTESVMLALLGGLAGVGAGALGIRFLGLLLNSGSGAFTIHAGIDWRVLSFNLAVTLLTGIVFGIAPAIQATGVDVTPALRESRAGAARTRTRRFDLPFGLSHVLVVSQIAISLLLVAGAGLFIGTLANLHSVQLGFNSQNLLLFGLDAGKAGYTLQGKPLYNMLRQRFLAIPGVTGATLTSVPLVNGWSDQAGISIPGTPPPAEGQRGPDTAYAQVGPSFFETMQIPIVAGRSIDERDDQGRQAVAVVNEVFARKYFAGVSPLGRHFGFGRGQGKDTVDLEIVGVARNAGYNSLKQQIPPVAYLSFLQERDNQHPHEMYFELRTSGDPGALANTVRQIVHQAAPLVPVADVTTHEHRIDATILQERIFAQLCSCFGALALVMACVGLYGTMAYAVARRTSEIGIRMALGAERRRIVWMVLREVCALCAAGLVIGFAMVWETTAFVKSFLFGMKPNDPLVLTASIAVLIAAAILAGYVPAWRASRIDPMVALRHE